MAAASSGLETQLYEELSCSICLELFTRPKVLPCQHTFCQDCLQNHAGRGGTFQCPACRQQVRLPPQGVSGLPEHFLVTRLCEMLQNELYLSSAPIPAAPAASDGVEEFQTTLASIFSKLDNRDARLLQCVWSARTGQRQRPWFEGPLDLMKAMVESGYIRSGDLSVVEKDMMAAGISFPAIAQDIPGIPKEFSHPKTAEVSVGPMGGEVAIPGFVKLVVPPGVLHRDTNIFVSIVDLPGILRSPEGPKWTSGYPWSLGEHACPREILDQVLFSPAIKVNLHGARLSGPVQLETWRPPGSRGMECFLLKHLHGEGWRDITASTKPLICEDKISMSMRTFCPLTTWWTSVRAVKDTVLAALTSRTLDCWFAAYIRPLAEKIEFHVVCRDLSIEADDYRRGFTLCGSNEAIFGLCNGDRIVVTVTVDRCQTTKRTILRAKQCRRPLGQKVQMFLDEPTRHPANGEVVVTKKTHGSRRTQTVCELTFSEEPNIGPQPDPEPSPRTVSSIPDVSSCFLYIKDRVADSWVDLAMKLGFSWPDIKTIKDKNYDFKSRCLDMLWEWRSQNGNAATIDVLMEALEEVRLKHVVDGLKKAYPELCENLSDS